MNLNKHLEFIEPATYKKPIHILGVGAVGSRVAEVLVRLGFDKITIYDFDIVEDVNITNQIYEFADIGRRKVEALTDHLKRINPHVVINAQDKYINQRLTGAIFLCVDSIELRRNIATKNISNQYIDVMFDLRMRLTDGQGYAANWKDMNQINMFVGSMQFNDAEDTTPVSVCGTQLSVAPTVLTLVSLQVMNFIRYLKNMEVKQIIFLDLLENSLITHSI